MLVGDLICFKSGPKMDQVIVQVHPSQMNIKADGKTGNKKRATCFATLLQNELNSDVARFTTHIKPVLQQIRLLLKRFEHGW